MPITRWQSFSFTGANNNFRVTLISDTAVAFGIARDARGINLYIGDPSFFFLVARRVCTYVRIIRKPYIFLYTIDDRR